MKSTKQKIVIGFSLMAILGVGGYFGYEWWKKRPKKGTVKTDEAEVNTGSTSSTGNTGSSKPKITITKKQINAATAYRIWANSTTALKNKYGKTSSFDLDASSSTPYNKFYLASVKVGGKEFLKYLSSAKGISDAAKLKAAQKIESQSKDWYILRSEELRDSISGYTSYIGEAAIIKNLQLLKTSADWIALANAYKQLTGDTLVTEVNSELNNTQKAKVNSNWASKKMLLENGTPVRLDVS